MEFGSIVRSATWPRINGKTDDCPRMSDADSIHSLPFEMGKTYVREMRSSFLSLYIQLLVPQPLFVIKIKRILCWRRQCRADERRASLRDAEAERWQAPIAAQNQAALLLWRWLLCVYEVSSCFSSRFSHRISRLRNTWSFRFSTRINRDV